MYAKIQQLSSSSTNKCLIKKIKESDTEVYSWRWEHTVIGQKYRPDHQVFVTVMSVMQASPPGEVSLCASREIRTEAMEGNLP